MALVAAGCGNAADEGTPTPAIPGLAEADEIPLVATEPDPSSYSFTWSDAYLVGNLPKVNVVQPTEEFMDAAHRDPDEASQLVCMGDASGSGGCGELNGPQPSNSGITFGGPDVRAWAWDNVPEQAVAVRFIDQDGASTWQRPADSLVRFAVFPDTINDDPDADCPCRFDAIGSDGVVICVRGPSDRDLHR